MKYDTVLFDLDGTLLNTLDDLADSVNTVMRQEGYKQRSKDEIRIFIGNGARMLLKRSLPEGADEKEIQRCLDLFREVYLRNMQNQTRPYDGIMELLKQLKARGIKIGVVSNKPDEATKEMCRLYFQNEVDAAIGDNIDRRKKPEPDNVFEAMHQLDARKEKTLYVGDSDTDVVTAKNAGLAFTGVTWGYRSREILVEAGAECIIDEPGQLVGVLV
jgi:haloacid dehalogenase superfamily, subfamily IA, variant 1 with third motif having Dx(3-4)D or Dx(3-4)E